MVEPQRTLFEPEGFLDSNTKARRLLEDFQRGEACSDFAFSSTGCNMEKGPENIQSGRGEPVSSHCVSPVSSSLKVQ